MKFRRTAGTLVLLSAMVFFLFSCGGGGGGESASPPVVTTSTTNSTGIDNAVLNGSVNPKGRDATAWFEYGTDNTLAVFTKTADQNIAATSTAVAFNQAISGLTAGTTYYFRAVASTTAGTKRGAIVSIATSALAPTVVTTGADNVTINTADLAGTVNPNGLATTAYFLFGTDNTLSSNTKTPDQDVGSGKTAVAISESLINLTPGTPYFYQIVATNSAGTSNGAITPFSTDVNPPPTANAGPDQAVFMGQSVALDGSGSNDTANGGTITSYAWTQVSGTTVTLTGATTANPTFTAPAATYPSQALTFQLTVTSSRGPTAVDNVIVTDKWGFFDDFSTDTSANYTVTLTNGADGTFSVANGHAIVTTGNDNALQFSPILASAPSTTGQFLVTFSPTVKYPNGGGIWIRLRQNATTYYEIANFDWDTTGDPGYVAKVVGGATVDNTAFAANYTQGQTYPISITFSPDNTTVTAFGETISLTGTVSSITVSTIEVESGQQDAFFDNLVLQAAP